MFMRKTNREVMLGQSKCRHCSSKVVQEVKTNAKRSYRRRLKEKLNNFINTNDEDSCYVDAIRYGYID